jgi:hypothetical protein
MLPVGNVIEVDVRSCMKETEWRFTGKSGRERGDGDCKLESGDGSWPGVDQTERRARATAAAA